MLLTVVNQKAKTSDEQRPKHVRKREDQQGAATKCIDGPHGRPGEEEVDQAKSKTGPESIIRRNAT